MIDDQVNAEELAESRRQRAAEENATDDGMPLAPEHKARDVGQIQYREEMAGLEPEPYAVLNVVSSR